MSRPALSTYHNSHHPQAFFQGTYPVTNRNRTGRGYDPATNSNNCERYSNSIVAGRSSYLADVDRSGSISNNNNRNNRDNYKGVSYEDNARRRDQEYNQRNNSSPHHHHHQLPASGYGEERDYYSYDRQPYSGGSGSQFPSRYDHRDNGGSSYNGSRGGGQGHHSSYQGSYWM